ncbi:protease modulator HflC [Planctomycetota bacterium]
MRNLAITIFIVLIVVTLGFYLVSFQVRETESCIVTTFGKATRQITEPDLYFKWPFPIQQVHKYDSRMRSFVVEPEETQTAGGEPIIVNTYVVWRIAEPLDFYTSIKTVQSAEYDFLRSMIRDVQNYVIGRHNFSDFVNSDESRVIIDDIQGEMLAELRQDITEAEYGIEIKTLGIRQLKISEDISTQVFERMRAERNQKAVKITSDGEAMASAIRAEADSISRILLSYAESRAKEIQGEGDAQAAQYYALLDEAPELAAFLRDIEALKEILKTNTKFVSSTDWGPLRLLKNIPDIEHAEPNEP